MKNKILKCGFPSLFALVMMISACSRTQNPAPQNAESRKVTITLNKGTDLVYMLPAPDFKGTLSVEEAIYARRSHRSYQDKEISDRQLSQILWAAYGLTEPRPDLPFMKGGFHSAPSAGATYPLEVYVLVGKVKGIQPGVYKYVPDGHKMVRTIAGDQRKELSNAALGQKMLQDAPAVLFFSAVFKRTTDKYGERGRQRYVCMDVGHAAENVYLQAEALHLGTCAVGAFDDEAVRKVMQLPAEEEPLYMMPFGYYFNKKEF
jgi:SagB-type dehydrogenase family enzyme